MPMTNAGRASAIYNAIASSSASFSKLSAAEKTAMQNQIQAVWGAGDLAYIQTNATVEPDTLNNPAGQVVTIPSTSPPGSPSAGTTTAPSVIAGTGKVS